MKYRIVKQHTKTKANFLGDVLIELKTPRSYKAYPLRLRLGTAIVELNGVNKSMTFITNIMDWTQGSICDLYICRWGVEVFFKQIKQTLMMGDFIGHSRNAILWQVWMALLAYVLIRFIGHLGQWKGAFSRLFTLLRGVLFSRQL